MKLKLLLSAAMASATLLLQGCIAFPPLIQVERKDAPANQEATQQIMKRLDAIDHRLDQLEHAQQDHNNK